MPIVAELVKPLECRLAGIELGKDALRSAMIPCL